MIFEEMFKPYSFELKGDLLEYLRNCENSSCSPNFYDFQHFFEIKEKKLIIPNHTIVHTNNSHIPDVGYIIDDNFMLKSNGPGEYNMSLMFAEKGIYDSKKILNKKFWSITGLDLWKDVENL